MPLLTKDVIDDGVSIDSTQYVSLEDGHRFRSRCDPERGDILICSRGTIGRCAAVEVDDIFCLMGSVILIKTSSNLFYRYIVRYLQSDIAQKWMRGASSATAVSALYLKDVTKCLVPLPSIAEQHRIVDKVDELMALCDELEKAKIEREESRNRLAAASLQRLNQPADDEQDFREDALFTFNHLPRITTRQVHIKQLRQTILNLAVRGRLAPQDPNDEPAAELLKKIQAEKTRLVKAGNLKKEKSLPPIAEQDEFVQASEWLELGQAW